MLGLVTQSCSTLCDPMDYSPPGSSVHGDSPGKSTGLDCHALLQGIFPTQGLNLGLWHCRQILYCYEPSGKPYSLLREVQIRVVFLKDNLASTIKSLSKRAFDNSIAKHHPKNKLSHVYTNVCLITVKK